MAKQAVTILFPPPSQFDVDFEGGRSNAIRWEKWMDEFEFYLAAHSITSDEQKTNFLLLCAGTRVREIYKVMPKPVNQTYSDMVKMLNDQFAPDTNKDFATLEFRQMKQHQGEGVDAFLYRLRRGAEPCGFGERLNDELRLQLLDGCINPSVKRQAFLEPKVFTTFEKVREYAYSLELVAMESSNQPGTSRSFDNGSQNKSKPGDLKVKKVTQNDLKKKIKSAVHKGSTAKEPHSQARKLMKDGYCGTMFYSNTDNMNFAETNLFGKRSDAHDDEGIVYVVQGKHRK